MATYYVRTDGSDTNAGTGPATNQAWQTITKAIGATGIAPSDTLYIAPGVYRGAFTAAFTSPSSEGQRITIAGNPTASQFSGVAAGPVIITNFTDPTTASGVLFTCQTRNYITFQDISFVGYRLGGNPNYGTNTAFDGTYQIFRRCGFYSPTQSGDAYNFNFSVGNGNRGPTIDDCVFFGYVGLTQTAATGASYNSQSLIRNSLFINANISTATNQCLRIDAGGTSQSFGGITVVNCRFVGNTGIKPQTSNRVNTTFPVVVQNCIFDTANGITSTTLGDFIESYNIFNCTTERTNVGQGTGSLVRAFISPDFTMSRLSGWANLPFWANHFASASQNAGINTNSDTTDFYGVTWLAPSTPTMGPVEYFDYSATGRYIPTERNASTITIAPGSTSQSIELYLGATGLTASTSGLSAYYNRTRSADVQITLVARTIGQPWTSGGFAEVNASTMPGVYRLDLPDAAVAAGADDVTIVVRGASGTNGAVMTVKLSSGGLTAAQTAQAVLDAVASTHNNIGSIGAFIQDKSGYSLSTSQTFNTTGSVGSVTGNVSGNVTGTVGGVVGNVVGNLTGSVATIASPDNIIDGVWDEQRVGHTASGSFGEKLQTNAMADEMLARDLGSGLNSGTAEERTVRSALRALRNKVNVGSSQMVVKKEDDTTDAWTASVTTTAVSSNVSGIDPN